MEIKVFINILPSNLYLASLDSSFKFLLKKPHYQERLPHILKPGQESLVPAPTDCILLLSF